MKDELIVRFGGLQSFQPRAYMRSSGSGNLSGRLTRKVSPAFTMGSSRLAYSKARQDRTEAERSVRALSQRNGSGITRHS